MDNPKLIINTSLLLVILNYFSISFATNVQRDHDLDLVLSIILNTLNPQRFIPKVEKPAFDNSTEQSPLLSSAVQLDQILFYLDDDTKLHHVNRSLFTAITGLPHTYILKKGFDYFDQKIKRPRSKIPCKRIDFAKVKAENIPSYILYSLVGMMRNLQHYDWPYLGIMNIHELDLSYNKIEDWDIEKLAQYLSKSQVSILDLSNNQFYSKGVNALGEFLPSTKITTLKLGGNKIGLMGDLKQFAKALPASRVRHLGLSGNDFTDEILFDLAQNLPDTKIMSLDLRFNKITDIGMGHLATALKSKKTEILILDLGGNEFADNGLILLAQALPATKIHTLNLDDYEFCKFTKLAGIHNLAQVLSITQIQILNLNSNNIGDTEINDLAPYLLKSKIITLNLCGNIIGDLGMSTLAKFLPDTKIQNLCLRSNKIGDAGIKDLAEALSKTYIVELDLGYNQFGKDGFYDLIYGFLETQINTVDLCDNNIGNDYLDILAQVLTETQIHTFDLHGNNINDTGALDLVKYLSETKVRKLSLRLNKISNNVKEQLRLQFPQIIFDL